MDLLETPSSKEVYKKLVKTKVIDYWEVMLRKEASVLSSLSFFNPSFMSLQRSHPIWLTAGHSPFKVAMATIQAKMLSGRYCCGYLTRHWSSSDGFVNYHLNVLISLRMLLIFYNLAPDLLKSDVILRILLTRHTSMP